MLLYELLLFLVKIKSKLFLNVYCIAYYIIIIHVSQIDTLLIPSIKALLLSSPGLYKTQETILMKTIKFFSFLSLFLKLNVQL